MAFGSNDPQIINEDEDTATNLLERILLGKRLQTFSLKRGIELPQGKEFDVWLGQLYDDAARIAAATPLESIAQEFVAICSRVRFAATRKREIRGMVAIFSSAIAYA
jgi:hypothetical protein